MPGVMLIGWDDLGEIHIRIFSTSSVAVSSTTTSSFKVTVLERAQLTLATSAVLAATLAEAVTVADCNPRQVF